MKCHLVRLLLGLLTAALLGSGAMGRTLELKTTHVTEADVAVSPDGKHLVLSILGHLFLLPVGGGDTEQLTFGACYDKDPAFSPDGRLLAFVSDRDGSGGNVFVLELASRKLRAVTHEPHAGQPTWTPDGKALVYLRFQPRAENPARRLSMFGGSEPCELRQIVLTQDAKPQVVRGLGLLRSIFYLSGQRLAWTVVEQETTSGSFFPRSTTHVETLGTSEGKIVRLRSVPGDLGRVAVSPAGDGLFCRSPELRFLPLPDGADQRVSALPGGRSASRFAVSADGKTIFVSDRGQIVKVSRRDGEREVVPLAAQVKLEIADTPRPRWSSPEGGSNSQARGVLSPQLTPNGRSLIFMAAGYLWRQPLDGKPAQRLLQGDAWESDPALAPDGRQLAFVSRQQGKCQLRTLDLENGQTHTLVDLTDGSRARFPSWSSDGKRLVFQKSEGLQAPLQLIAVNLADGKEAKLASAAGDWSARPHFNPEGDALYFTSRTTGPGTVYRLLLKDQAKPEAVTSLSRHVNDARVSPNGKWLALRRNTEIWVAPLDRGPITEKNLRRLSFEGGPTFTFTADSSALVYAVGSHVWRHPLADGAREEIPLRLSWRRATPPPLLLRRVRVLDFGTGQFGAETSLLVERGLIRWIGAERDRKLPENVVVLDAAGRYAIPGLFDFHVHSVWANHEADPDTFLAYGITSVRDTGGGLETLGALADRGDIRGDPLPRYFYSGEIFEGPQPIWGDAFLQIFTDEEARRHVRQWKERGVHFIKVYPSLPWPLQRVVADEARRQGLPVVGHGIGLEEIVKSVTLGYAGLEHCPMSLQEDVQKLLLAAGTRCDPTLAILGGHSNLLRKDPKRLDDAKLRAFFAPAFIRAARGGGLPGMGSSWSDRLAELRFAYRGGIKLHVGTDSLMTGTFFGASLHWEMEHFVEASLKPLDVLRLASAEAAIQMINPVTAA
jgi:Tol biopolymer transport system component